MRLYTIVLLLSIATCMLRHNSFITEGFKPLSQLWNATTYQQNIFKEYNNTQITALFTHTAPKQYNLQFKYYPQLDNFDSRNKWPLCISTIKDIGNCAASWATSTVDTFSDRMCIKNNVPIALSSQDMLSCDSNDFGCQGGFLNNAWAYLQQTGVVTDACKPYTSSNGYCPTCTNKCSNPEEKYLKYKCSKPFSILYDVQAMQREIINNGPLQSTIDVYRDFLYYQSGIYVSDHKSYLGSLPVKVIGWGNLNGVNYWLAANSWGEKWGEKGYFRIGLGESSIIAQMSGCNLA